jgi:glycosyltransferase involved in cell wall biosynthesis
LAIRSLDIGGAERQFVELVRGIDKSRFDVTICTMYGGVREDEVQAIEGIRYVNLQKEGRYDLWKFGRRYRALLRGIRPDVLYAFLGEMNLFSLWCKPKKTKLIWGFRASNMDLKQYGKMSQLLFWLQKQLSPKVDRIVANSHASVMFHKEQGFDISRAVVIPNGIDIERFRPDETLRGEFRAEYGVAHDEMAVGIVARIDAMKGYPIFAKAMRKLLESDKKLRVFAVGDGSEKIRKECEAILGEYNDIRFLWLGTRNDVEKIYNGLDLYVSSSLSESFSNTIAEAMACGTPCVVTDVGDSALIVGDTGRVVPARDFAALGEGIERMLSEDLPALGRKARRRIVENFSTEKMVEWTEGELKACVAS